MSIASEKILLSHLLLHSCLPLYSWLMKVSFSDDIGTRKMDFSNPLFLLLFIFLTDYAFPPKAPFPLYKIQRKTCNFKRKEKSVIFGGKKKAGKKHPNFVKWMLWESYFWSIAGHLGSTEVKNNRYSRDFCHWFILGKACILSRGKTNVIVRLGDMEDKDLYSKAVPTPEFWWAGL